MSVRYIRISSYVSSGLEPQNVFIDGLRCRGLSQLQLSGLPDAWLRESRDKIKALVSRILPWGPIDRILIHLLPAEMSKTGAHLELPIALACLALLDESPTSMEMLEILNRYKFAASLDLNGDLQRTGVSQALEIAKPDLVLGASRFKSLEEVWAFVKSGKVERLPGSQKSEVEAASFSLNEGAGEIEGRYWERFWLLTAAVARLPVLLLGPPGTGKSRLAQWAQRFVPPASTMVAFQQRQIWNIAGLRAPQAPPCISPHARTHLSEFIGTQSRGVSRPGFFSLAHGGLLILDEFLEMNRDCREILRSILDSKRVLRALAEGGSHWPADFWLIATSNPCPCGHSVGEDLSRCRCPEPQRRNYQARLSGPLYERFGLRLFIEMKSEDARLEPVMDPSKLDASPETLRTWVTELQQKRVHLEAEAFQAVQSFRGFAKYSRREQSNKAKLLSALMLLINKDPLDLVAWLALKTDLEEHAFASLGSPYVQEAL